MSQSDIQKYRSEYRKAFISESYKGRLHFLFTASLSVLVIVSCLANLESVSSWEWLTIPLTFLYANFAEWAGHRFGMHRPVKGIELVYRRHTLQHHRFFTHEHMEIDSTSDYKAVLFPPVLVTFFLIAFFLPFGLVMGFVFGSNVALLATATGMGYFLNYEILHFSYHLPAHHWVHKMPGFAKLMELHPKVRQLFSVNWSETTVA